MANVGFVLTPFSWGSLKTNIGTDNYANQNLILRNPESAAGFSSGGILDQADVITRNISAQTFLNFNSHRLTNSISISGLVGNSVSDFRTTTDAAVGTGFLDPNFVSINNTSSRLPKTTAERLRRVSFFGQAALDYRNYLFLTVTGRNDRTSTIPPPRNSFFYPSASLSFVFSDAFPGLQRFVTGKLRAAIVGGGKDARPYAYRPALQYKTTSFGGYGYDFWGPNFALKPERSIDVTRSGRLRRSTRAAGRSAARRASCTTASDSMSPVTTRSPRTRSSTTSAAAMARASFSSI